MNIHDANVTALDLLAGLESGFALSVLDSSPDCIKILDLQGRLLFMNRNGMCAMEIAQFAEVADRPWPSLWPAKSHALLEGAVEAAIRGEVRSFEAFCPTARGNPRWWHVTSAPVRGARGVERIIVTSRDITELVQARTSLEEEVAAKNEALRRQKLLLSEIDHRVKNSFAAVMGLLRMQARRHRGDPSGQALTDAATRIATLARVHDQLHLDPSAPDLVLCDYIGALAGDLGQALNARVEMGQLPDLPIRVNATQAAGIGQLVAELIGNAIKHSGGRRRARVLVDIEPLAEGLSIAVQDNGPGLPEGFDPAAQDGLGMQICLTYVEQMQGRLEHGRSDLGGARFRAIIRPEPLAAH
ncbi:sensor histidine kinase [Paracoccus sp. C2R09]|nr:PAS domain-containing protein [Paracoccus sp. C2R09]MBU2958731.1 PAS domain-containing protein [Paracoccus sp. C2R09]